ncbi:hypothetical protein [Acaryochloris thomasi]|nr:hypothetical protein [Acaryochloris thomasi]
MNFVGETTQQIDLTVRRSGSMQDGDASSAQLICLMKADDSPG